MISRDSPMLEGRGVMRKYIARFAVERKMDGAVDAMGVIWENNCWYANRNWYALRACQDEVSEGGEG